MAEVQRDLFVLISIAKVDAALHATRMELNVLPRQVDKIRKSLEVIEGRERESAEQVEEMTKERRALEQLVEDNAEKVKKYRIQLMEVKTNREYTAMLHEIEHIENDTDAKEERLLVLMDELDQETDQSNSLLEDGKKERAGLTEEQSRLEERIKLLEAEVQRLESEKPKLLTELDPHLTSKYNRILAKLHDYAVTNVVDETCQGCFTRVPPQLAVEVRRNERIIECEACGRILVHYTE
jgi:predicted  nucleic acid-binding Zn-ribbon protein